MTTAQNLQGFIPAWTVGDRVRKIREHLGLSQYDLAEAIEYSRGTIANIEQGVREPRRGMLIAIAFATGVDLHWLETGETPSGDLPTGGSSVGHQGLEPRTR
ncbi:helix-turn-helix domain-containing protein [Corynebacterium freiburgense]|uniref:helix-turn-helix domain-containing protein n=1 Tax=Corynebacterium freiburgense TaxID=556548 RepID=UPI0006880119|nr:helix-turn-helix transcriptional regulator [Corynebacterium freiburgense]